MESNFTKLDAGTSPQDPENYYHIKFQASVGNVYYPCEDKFIDLFDESEFPYMVAYVPHHKESNKEIVIVKKAKDPETDVHLEIRRMTRTWEDGMYQFIVSMQPLYPNMSISASVTVDLHSRYGFLSAIDWPLLPFNAAMAFGSLILATIWLMMWAKSQKHTHRIHVVIGTVAVIAALTHTVQFIQYSLVNSSGQGVSAIKWFSLVANVVQLCVFSLLLMVVSVGYGLTRFHIVHKLMLSMIVLTTIQFVSELSWQVVQDEDLQIQYKLPSFSKAVLWFKATVTVIIAGWVMVASMITLVHIWRGQHTGKIRIFTVFLLGCIVIFLAQMVVFGLSMGWMQSCRKHWKWNWIIASYSSLKNMVLLTLMMWLWRPLDISQTYAFVPLGLNMSGDELDDEEEVEHLQNEEVEEYTAMDVNDNTTDGPEEERESLVLRTL